MSKLHTIRKPGAQQLRGLNKIAMEVETTIADMRCYHNADESRRADDLAAGLEYLLKIINAARNSNHERA